MVDPLDRAGNRQGAGWSEGEDRQMGRRRCLGRVARGDQLALEGQEQQADRVDVLAGVDHGSGGHAGDRLEGLAVRAESKRADRVEQVVGGIQQSARRIEGHAQPDAAQRCRANEDRQRAREVDGLELIVAADDGSLAARIDRQRFPAGRQAGRDRRRHLEVSRSGARPGRTVIGRDDHDSVGIGAQDVDPAIGSDRDRRRGDADGERGDEVRPGGSPARDHPDRAGPVVADIDQAVPLVDRDQGRDPAAARDRGHHADRRVEGSPGRDDRDAVVTAVGDVGIAAHIRPVDDQLLGQRTDLDCRAYFG